VFAGNAAFALSAIVDVAVVCGALVWGLRPPADAKRLAVALSAALAVLAIKGLAMLALGLAIPFGVMHVVWLDLVVVVPLAAVVVLLRGTGGALRAAALGGPA
jgi:heme A synthase